MCPEISKLLVTAKIGHTFQEVYQGNIQATRKAGNAQATRTHAHTRLCDTLGKHSGFHWADVQHNVVFAQKVISCQPQDYELQRRLSTAFSMEEKHVELQGRGCREQENHLLGEHGQQMFKGC